MSDNPRSREHTARLVLLAMTAAIIWLTTWLIKIPFANGYYHIGDAFIFASASILGPYAGLSAAIGSALADISAGYVIYVPVTAIIKGIMGTVSGLFLRRMYASYSKSNDKLSLSLVLRSVILFVLCELIMCGGYFLFEIPLYSLPTAAANILFNLLQGAVGVVLGAIIVPLIKRVNIGKML